MNIEIDDRTRTPPHGDPLRPGKDYELRGSEIVDSATRRAMAGPEIPHNEAGVPIMPGATVADAIDRIHKATARVAAAARTALEKQRRLPSHIERAARQAYAAGHRDGCGHFMDGEREGCDDQRGVDAFRESLQHDAEEAVKDAEEQTAAAAPHEIDLMQALTDSLKERGQ